MSVKQNFYTLPQFHQVSLLYSTELKDILKSPLPDKVQYFLRKKTEGTDLFNKKDYSSALEKYYQALTLFRWIENRNPNWSNRQISDADLIYRSEDLNEEVRGCLTIIYLNIAICSLKLEQWKESELACDEVLKIDEKNVKALYRKAQAIASPPSACGEDYKRAIKLLKLALQIDPKNLVVWQKLNEIKQISQEKVSGIESKKSVKDPASKLLNYPIGDIDDMVAKWEFMVNHMKSNSDNTELKKFQKNLEKIKKYKAQLRTSLGISEGEINKLKNSEFGIDVNDFIMACEQKEAKEKGSNVIRNYPLLKEENWEGWYYVLLFVLIFCGLFVYNLEARGIYG